MTVRHMGNAQDEPESSRTERDNKANKDDESSSTLEAKIVFPTQCTVIKAL